MSGAPVLDLERDRVVGIITERYKEQYNPAVSNMAFALPVKSMIDLYANLREKNRGLTVLSKFLHAISEEETSIYKWIDEAYVPPLEYHEIKSALKRDSIVFITGTKEFGKTFTAVSLLYEYFKEGGYQPRWVHERKQQWSPEGADPEELARIMHDEGYIKPHQIVYFEDPFGKTKYERSSNLGNYIASIIVSIQGLKDAYVIITSREVFKEFEREHLSSIDLENFEKKMNLKRASYDIKKRKEMLLRWAKVNNCRWLLNSALTDLVLEAIEKQMLPTPLNIRDFVKASGDVLDNRKLSDLTKQISEKTSRRFADEIMNMKEDEKVLLLSFAYIRPPINVDLVEEMFDSIASELEPYPMSFKDVIKWFEGDKIDISEHKIIFSHPSYQEALEYAVYSKKSSSNRIRHIFIIYYSRS